MRMTLYQIDPSLDKERVRFMGYGPLVANNIPVNPEIYRAVWTGDRAPEQDAAHALEAMYLDFNHTGDRPLMFDGAEHYTGRSMSVSDVVVMDDPDEGVRAWYCDSFGFVPLPEEVWPCRG